MKRTNPKAAQFPKNFGDVGGDILPPEVWKAIFLVGENTKKISK